MTPDEKKAHQKYQTTDVGGCPGISIGDIETQGLFAASALVGHTGISLKMAKGTLEDQDGMWKFTTETHAMEVFRHFIDIAIALNKYTAKIDPTNIGTPEFNAEIQEAVQKAYKDMGITGTTEVLQRPETLQ